MFANTQMMGMDLGFPDVCLTPMPVPVPIPYPNFGMGPIGIPAAYTILYFGLPAHNMLTTIPLTFGDLPGLVGVCCGTVMAPARHITAAFTVLLWGLPATRHDQHRDSEPHQLSGDAHRSQPAQGAVARALIVRTDDYS